MTLTRSRLTAVALCGLLALIVYLLAVTASGPWHRDQSPSVQALTVDEPMPPMAMPPASTPLRRAEFEASPIATAGPQIAPTAAPGVAFNYRYAFRLPSARIAEVQERHAELCERLTAARCRIAGMYYHLNEDGRVEARLELRLAPALARRFGRTSVEMVARAEGLLAESEISGVDAAGSIRAAGRSIAELEANLARIETELRQTRPTSRPELEYQAQQLRDQIRALRDGRESDRESLATTPMLLQYAAGVAAAAPSEPPTLKSALDRSTANLLGGLGILMIILVTLLPWALAGLGAWLLFRLIRRHFPASSPLPAA